MRESACPRRRALAAASTAAVLLLCSGQPHVAEALTTGGGAPSAALRMTTVASTTSRGSLSRGVRIPGQFHGRKSAGASSSPLFSSGTGFAHRHNNAQLVGAAAGSRQHADPSATRLHATVRYTDACAFVFMYSIVLSRRGDLGSPPKALSSAYLVLLFLTLSLSHTSCAQILICSAHVQSRRSARRAPPISGP